MNRHQLEEMIAETVAARGAAGAVLLILEKDDRIEIVAALPEDRDLSETLRLLAYKVEVGAGIPVGRHGQTWQPARQVAEISRAHDILVALIEKEVPIVMAPEADPLMRSACDVLCWVLGHVHNTKFGDNLAKIESFLQRSGFQLRQRPAGE